MCSSRVPLPAVILTARIVSQTIGGAFLVSAAESAFVNTLISKLHEHAPSVDPSAVLAAGATGLRESFSDTEYPAILSSYMTAISATFLIATASTGLAFLVALFAKWTSIKGRTVVGAA